MADNDTQSFPGRSDTALLIIDVINDLDFSGGEDMLPHALEMAEHLAELKRRASEAGVAVVYLNDNFGQWRSDFRGVVDYALTADQPGAAVVRKLEPGPEDYFVLKPKHSGFFGTTLETLLRFLGTRRLILTGITADMCVLFTAIDAYMRDYQLAVPADCTVSTTSVHTQEALAYMQRVLKADTRPARELPLKPA